MCLNYVSYYPATPALSQCMSSMDDATAFPSMQEFDAFGQIASFELNHARNQRSCRSRV